MRVLRGLVLMLIAMTLAGCAATSKGSGEQRTPDQTLKTEAGEFLLSGLSIYPDILGTGVKGQVTNNTGKRWTFVAFNMDLIVGDGSQIGTAILTASNLAPGQTMALSGISSGQAVAAHSSKAPITRMRLRFSGGSMPTRYVIEMSKPVASAALTMSDANLEFVFSPNRDAVAFQLRNKGQHAAKIDWNSVAYIDSAGTSNRVMHDGVKLSSRGEIMSPTLVPPGASIKDALFPDSLAVFSNGWHQFPMLPVSPEARRLKGKTLSVFMPIEIDGRVRPYSFEFVIKDVVDGE